MINHIKMREVYFVELDPVVGHEIGGGKPRPVIVVSINGIHQNTGVVTVIPGTSRRPPKPYWNVVQVDPSSENGLSDSTYFQCHHVRSIDQRRMTDRAVGRVSHKDLQRVQQTIWEVLGWIRQS